MHTENILAGSMFHAMYSPSIVSLNIKSCK